MPSLAYFMSVIVWSLPDPTKLKSTFPPSFTLSSMRLDDLAIDNDRLRTGAQLARVSRWVCLVRAELVEVVVRHDMRVRDRTARAAGVPPHPIEIYEMLAYFIVFAVLWITRKNNASGRTFLTYLGAYGVARFAMEFFRGDPAMLGWGLHAPPPADLLTLSA